MRRFRYRPSPLGTREIRAEAECIDESEAEDGLDDSESEMLNMRRDETPEMPYRTGRRDNDSDPESITSNSALSSNRYSAMGMSGEAELTGLTAHSHHLGGALPASHQHPSASSFV